MEPDRLDLGLFGDTAIVTGASSGIGEATARLLAQAGAQVALLARSEDRLEAIAAEIEADGGTARAVRCDVSQAPSVEEAVDDVEAWAGPVARVAHVAGYPLDAELWGTPLHELDDEAFERVRAVDLDGARRVTQAVLPGMLDAGGGSMVFVSSTPALDGYKGTPYTEAKAALLGLTKDVAREYGAQGVRANAVALGNIATDATLENTDQDYEEAAHEAALARWGEPAEAAGAIASLLSPATSFVTGQTLVVDGGSVMR